jgi:signal transduction histidine kinase
MLRSILLFVFFGTWLFARAQNSNYIFTNYTTAQGLPDNNIQSITQDSRGFLWIGTAEGLSRFDGKNFKNFFAAKNDSIIKANNFSDIYEYKKGHLVMNNYSQVICLNTYTEQFYLPGFASLGFIRISKGRHQKGFYLTADDKVYIADDKLQITDSITQLPEADKSNTLSVYYFQDKITLILYNHKYYFYYHDTKKYGLLPVDFKLPGAGFFPYFRHYDEVKQELYFSEYNLGMYRYSLLTKKTVFLNKASTPWLFTNTYTYQAVEKGPDELWFLTNRGISILHKSSDSISYIHAEKNKPGSLTNDLCFTSCTDKDNNFWIGTYNGISKLNANSLAVKYWDTDFATTPENGLMSVVKGSDENIYASVYFGKTYQVNTVTNKTSVLNHPLNTGNWNLFANRDEIIRTGTGNSLLSYNVKTKQFRKLDFLKPFYPDIELIVLGFLHSNGDEWYSANRGGGFVRRQAGTDTYKTYKKNDGINTLTSTYYTSHTEDKKGDLWFGVNKTSNLVHWNINTDKFNEIDFFKVPGVENIIHTGINTLTADAENNIWIAFNGSGLIKYVPKQNKATSFTIADGLPSNFIMGMQFDNKNRLWLTTAKGLSCYIINENKFINFKKEDGLPNDYFSDYCTYFDAEKNKLWLGANSTLMQFNPDDLLKSSRENFSIYADEIFINGKKYLDTLQNDFFLNASENNVQFHFTGVDLNKGKDIEYSYMLLGADKDWINTAANQTASYANLKPGDYTFKVRARHKGYNKWNETEMPIRFTIATPWNKTWWFVLLVIAAAAFLTWYLIKSYYSRKLEQQKAFLEKQQAVETERTRIATDMHDDFGASLSRIKFLSEKIKIQDQEKEMLNKDLNKISDYSDEMAEKMNEIVWALNQKYDSLGDLVAFCRAYASDYLSAYDIQLHFTDNNLPDIKIQGEIRRNIFLVMKESLHNIIKHAGASTVNISFKLNNGLTLDIADNGKGIDINKIRPFANGLQNMKKRIASINGTISFVNNNGTGISIIVPLN